MYIAMEHRNKHFPPVGEKLQEKVGNIKNLELNFVCSLLKGFKNTSVKEVEEFGFELFVGILKAEMYKIGV